jgi:hypothetical protein
VPEGSRAFLRPHQRIGLRGEASQLRFQALSGRLLILLGSITRQLDRRAVDEDASSEGKGDQEAIPRREEFFFEQE